MLPSTGVNVRRNESAEHTLDMFNAMMASEDADWRSKGVAYSLRGSFTIL